MVQLGEVVFDRRLGRPASIPEPGAWFRADEPEPDGELWISVVDLDEQGFKPLELAWERLRHLDHPAIPRVVAADPEAGAIAVAAPAGVPLSALLEVRHEPEFVMTPATVLDVARQLSEALVHAHERGRPHGHLAPEQIWVSPAGQLVIWGFGVGPDAAPSPTWVAPERARGRRSSGDADQWAMAAIVGGLVTGRVPWPSGEATLAAIGDTQHLVGPVMEQWAPLGRLLERALSSEPKNRFPSVHPLRQAFAALEQRVRQDSDLGRMATLLSARRGELVESGVARGEEPRPVSAVRSTPSARPAASPLPAPIAAEEDDEATELLTAVRTGPPPVRPRASPGVPAPVGVAAASPAHVAPDAEALAEISPAEAHAARVAADRAAVERLVQDPTVLGTRPTAVPKGLADGTLWREEPVVQARPEPARQAEGVAPERPPRPQGERLVVGPSLRVQQPSGITVVAPWVVGGMLVLMVFWAWWSTR